MNPLMQITAMDLLKNELQLITDQSDLEDILCQQNQKHAPQSLTTPIPSHPELKQAFDNPM
jgi:hypothetical protein